MRKFISKAALFFLIIIALDVATGYLFDYFQANAKGGTNARSNHICDEGTEDILVFGSSRAIHHYNPDIIASSTGLSCYNCGQDGQGIILNYGRLRLLTSRYQPKVIVYDLSGFDVESGDNHKYLASLRPFYYREGIPEIFSAVDRKERIKMLSSFYRYNSTFLSLILNYIHPVVQDHLGYRPLQGKLDSSIPSGYSPDYQRPAADSLKLSFVKKFIELSEGSKLIFVVSPVWDGVTSDNSPIKELCAQKGLPFIDMSADPRFLRNDEVFRDYSHLNSEGADEFTDIFCREQLLPLLAE